VPAFEVGLVLRSLILIVLFAIARDAPANIVRMPRLLVETPLVAQSLKPRTANWAESLGPIEVASVATHVSTSIRLYSSDGAIDEEARSDFERAASIEDDPHPLALRLEQLVMKAAYHFKQSRVVVVSGWRPNAGRHGTGDALDFKLEGVRAAQLAAFLRQLPRAGVGIYTHPRTQFVHLDVREPSYHWLDASPPGIKWRAAQLRDPWAQKRDASWTPEMDLPL
jgi:hypothetical protein